jgi:hypothetical protein
MKPLRYEKKTYKVRHLAHLLNLLLRKTRNFL